MSTRPKISSGNCARLSEVDRFPLYGFARHLQLRNLDTLHFIRRQHERYLAGDLEEELTGDEREMHVWIADNPSAAHELFRAGAMNTMLPLDAEGINVIVCRAPLALRTSTNPAVRISSPGRQSIFGEMFNSLRTWWLTLDRNWGAFIVAGGPPGFSMVEVAPEVARVVNRQYLVQFLDGSARYLIADDAYLDEDLEWADFTFAQRTTRGSRYHKVSSTF